MRLDVVSVPAEQTLPDYLKSGWMDKVDPQSVEEFTINGFPAATTTAKGEQWSFRLFAVRFGSDVYRFIFAAKTMTPQTDHSFRDAIMTFRRMSLKESQQVRPLRLKAVDGRQERHGGEPRAPHGGRSRGGAFPRAQRPRPARQHQAGRAGEARRVIDL